MFLLSGIPSSNEECRDIVLTNRRVTTVAGVTWLCAGTDTANKYILAEITNVVNHDVAIEEEKYSLGWVTEAKMLQLGSRAWQRQPQISKWTRGFPSEDILDQDRR